MAVFQAFFDAAGDLADPNIHVLSLAGWIAPEARWRRLNRVWKDICVREGVTGLHMREFAHSTGEYASWRGDEHRRQKFLGELAKAIHRHTNRDFSQSAFLDGYRAVDAQFQFHERVGSPYGICALLCIKAVMAWMSKKHPNDDVMFIFEKGDTDQDEIRQHLKRDKIDLGHDPLFMDKRWKDGDSVHTLPALECADFLAYEHHKNLTDVYLKDRAKGRGSLWTLGQQGVHFGVEARGWRIVDGRFFELAAEGFNVPRRPGAPAGPIPHEFDALEKSLKDRFHKGEHRDIRIVPRSEPLPILRDKRRRPDGG